jgi:catechol 2,3-dioxygenase-like lactoylglutathione lyase family enzyme
MRWTLEVIGVPVADIDRAKAFYAAGLGFAVDLDTQDSGGMRLVQLTPPGSGCPAGRQAPKTWSSSAGGATSSCP